MKMTLKPAMLGLGAIGSIAVGLDRGDAPRTPEPVAICPTPGEFSAAEVYLNGAGILHEGAIDLRLERIHSFGALGHALQISSNAKALTGTFSQDFVITDAETCPGVFLEIDCRGPDKASGALDLVLDPALRCTSRARGRSA